MLASCAVTQVPNIKLHAEIPFQDGAEGVYVETVSGDRGLVPHEEWVKERPTMLMISSKDWAKIKKSWLRACRIDREKCNIAVDSIDKIVQKLDELAKLVIGTE